ncbi:MAG: IS30 family transposase, partial [Erysipelotrichaceae bacterium]|nr:IS30 family transposase [Erysipelotrichaceae bacterium]
MGERVYKHLTYNDRLKIETLFNRGKSVSYIANVIRTSRVTIYRELKKGEYIKKSTELVEVKGYSADLAHNKYLFNLQAKGKMIKIGYDKKLSLFIETKIADEHYSPEAVVKEIKNNNLQFNTTVCFKTIYNYIDKDIFLRLTNKDLPIKKCRREYKTIRVREHKRVKGVSISERDESILSRDEFGHWEMDTVKGKIKSKSSLLVLTERKTRKEILIKLPKHTAQSVVEALDGLEEKYQDKFHIIFKTITCDNGLEFSYTDEIVKSKINQDKNRTRLYYCHPYSSWERGSNEVNNRFIRRYIPKFTCFDSYPEEYFKKIEDFMN